MNYNASSELPAAMEERRRRKRMKLGFSSSPHSPLDLFSFDQKAFPLMLAAASSIEVQKPSSLFLLKCFLRAHIAVLTAPTRSPLPPFVLLPRSLLALLPLFLTSSRGSLAVLSARLIGAASLCSPDANAIMASEEAIVNGLIRALMSRNKRVAVAACNAVLDLSVSSIGRKTLRDFSVLETLLSLLCQVYDSSIGFLSLIHRDNFLPLVLDSALILINTSDEGCFRNMSDNLSKKVLPLLKELWRNQRNLELSSNYEMEQGFVQSKMHDLAAAVFRLSVDHVLHVPWNADVLRGVIFGDEESNFENFILNFWESSPLLIQRKCNKSESKRIIFNSLSKCFGCMKDKDGLTPLMGKLVSCPPIASDELDIFNFIKEANPLLGSQICYGQDIRVLKSSKISSDSERTLVDEEIHFFNHSVGSKFVDELSVKKLKEALRDGYTIALRGMEFRDIVVGAIAEGLSNLFGQPLVGANIYLTPPRSQGLAKHYDDHCVLVWQIFGEKQWRISRRAQTLFPRLYEPLCPLQSLTQVEDGYMDVLIREGDILYIPRGFPHEAHTFINMDESNDDSNDVFSMHLTIGIEVEPPFEWEGFAHIALHCWNMKKKKVSVHPIDSEIGKLRSMFVNMLHVAVRLIADKNIVFKKACLIAALPYSPNNKHFLESTFDHIIETIKDSSIFSETFVSIVTAVQDNDGDFFLWMRWLRHLPWDEEDEKVNFDNPLEVFKEFMFLNNTHANKLAADFSSLKSEFCRSLVFEDACVEFMVLLETYRKTRKQYMNGMLSLHVV